MKLLTCPLSITGLFAITSCATGPRTDATRWSTQEHPNEMLLWSM